MFFGRVAVRKMILAALAAWIAVSVIALPSAANAQQQRGGGQQQDRARPQFQDTRRSPGFSGMLGEIAGARLDRAHVDKRDRSERQLGPGPGGGRGGPGGPGPGGGGGGRMERGGGGGGGGFGGGGGRGRGGGGW